MAQQQAVDEGTIRITPDGAWLHDDSPVAEPVAALFCRHVTLAEGGDYVIEWQKQRHVVAVDDAAFFVRQADVVADDSGLQRVELTLSDGSREALRPETLMQSADNVLYCRIERNGYSVPCRFDRSQYHSLAEWVEESKKGGFVLPLGQGAHPIQDYDAKPRARRAKAKQDN